jgi:T5SS/PEP-CTERM-associated repeat protein
MTVLLAVLQLPIGRADAASTFWNGSSWDSFTYPGNWSPIPPAVGVDAVIGHGNAFVGPYAEGLAQDISIGTNPAVPAAGLAVTFNTICGTGLPCTARLTSRHTAIGHSGAGVSGSAWVGNPGAVWNNIGDLFVGYGSTGTNTLEVLYHGRVSSGRGFIGYAAGTSGTATIGRADDLVSDDGRWNNSGELFVGYAGAGTLAIENGGAVTSATSYLGYGPSSIGTVTVIGAGSTWTSSGTLYVGNQSTAQNHLNVQEGAVVSSFGGRIGWEAGANGRVTVGNNGRWNTGQISVGNLGAGVLNVYNGGIVSASDSVSVYPASSVSGNGTIQGDIYSDGHTRPGAGPPGTLHITGDYSQSHLGTLHIDISNSGYDSLAVNGDLSLAGTLSLELPLFFPVWFPTFGDTFNVLDWTGTLSGTFNTLQLPALPAMRRWNTSQLYTTGVISIDLLPTGDYSKDGVVDATDYVVWRKTLGRTGLNLAADGNGDRKIDNADFNLWRAHFGETFGAGAANSSSNATVPEPTLLPLMAAIFLCTPHRSVVAKNRG